MRMPARSRFHRRRRYAGWVAGPQPVSALWCCPFLGTPGFGCLRTPVFYLGALGLVWLIESALRLLLRLRLRLQHRDAGEDGGRNSGRSAHELETPVGTFWLSFIGVWLATRDFIQGSGFPGATLCQLLPTVNLPKRIIRAGHRPLFPSHTAQP